MLGRVHQDAVVGMSLHILLEILRPLESLATEVAFVRLERNVDADVRGDVVTLHGGGAAGSPLAGEVEIVSALAADVALADMVLRRVSCVVVDVHVRCDAART